MKTRLRTRLEVAQQLLDDLVKKDSPGRIPDDAKAVRVDIIGPQRATITCDKGDPVTLFGAFAEDLEGASE